MNLRVAMLAGAAALYALAGSPTPDNPGWAEIAILLLLLAAIPWQKPRGIWVAPMALLLAYGATVPLLVGTLAGAAPADILRDMIGFAALAMPLLFAPLFTDNRARAILLAMLCGTGIAFAGRYLAATSTPVLGAIGMMGGDPGLLYLANSPAVAFAATWLLLHGCFGETRGTRAALCIALAVIPILAMAGMMQRATLVLLACAWSALFLRACVFQPRRALALAGVLAAALLVMWEPVGNLVANLYGKTLAVGWNARGAEFTALLAQFEGHPLRAVFGAGWGSYLKSPAVGDTWVRFSHALLTATLWKAGVIGLVLACAGLGALVVDACRRLRADAPMLLALAVPLIPALFLYGSYKSFCFGLLLLGLAVLIGQTGPRGVNQTPQFQPAAS